MLIYRYKQRLKEEYSNEHKGKAEAGWEEGHEVEAEQENAETLESKKVPELKELAKDKGIEGFNNMKKEELIDALKVGD